MPTLSVSMPAPSSPQNAGDNTDPPARARSPMFPKLKNPFQRRRSVGTGASAGGTTPEASEGSEGSNVGRRSESEREAEVTPRQEERQVEHQAPEEGGGAGRRSLDVGGREEPPARDDSLKDDSVERRESSKSLGGLINDNVITDLRRRLHQFEEELASRDAALTNALKKERERASRAQAASEERSQYYQTQLAQTSEQLSTARAELERAHAEVAALKNAVARLEEENGKYEDERNGLLRQVNEQQNLIVDIRTQLQNETSKRECEVAAAQASADARVAEEDERGRRAVEEVQQRLDSTLQTLNTRSHQLANLRANNEDLTSRLASATAEVENLQAQIAGVDDLRRERDDAVREAGMGIEVLRRVRVEVETCVNGCEGLEGVVGTIDKATTSTARANETVDALHNALQQLQERNGDQLRQLEDMRVTVVEARRVCDQARTQMDTAAHQVNAERAEKDNMANQLHSLETVVAELQHRLTSRDSYIAELRKLLEERQKAYEIVVQDLEQSMDHVTGLVRGIKGHMETIDKPIPPMPDDTHLDIPSMASSSGQEQHQLQPPTDSRRTRTISASTFGIPSSQPFAEKENIETPRPTSSPPPPHKTRKPADAIPALWKHKPRKVFFGGWKMGEGGEGGPAPVVGAQQQQQQPQQQQQQGLAAVQRQPRVQGQTQSSPTQQQRQKQEKPWFDPRLDVVGVAE
ncbi:hypothetical protein HK104_008467 [Borealophlyctis nickersoniae]|nr:hypothetical protein HK104_008467 [Borealophlyctis nickersoniae]